VEGIFPELKNYLKNDKIDKNFTHTVERKYFLENIEPFLNSKVENSIGFCKECDY
jgi:hypothetical protein